MMSDDHDDPDEFTPSEIAAADRTNIPGILLVLTSMLNLLLALGLLFSGFHVIRQTDEEFRRDLQERMNQARQVMPGIITFMEQHGAADQRLWQAMVSLIWGALMIAVAVVTFYAGSRM